MTTERLLPQGQNPRIKASVEPSPAHPHLAYQNGGLYEVLLGLAVLAVMWSVRNPAHRPGDLAWLVLGLFAAGRFFEFFARSDSPGLALRLDSAQWTSIALLVAVVAGWRLTTSHRLDMAESDHPPRA